MKFRAKCETDFSPSGQPVDSCPVQLQVARPLSSASECCHDDHELGEARSIPISQHVCGHRNERVEEDRTHSFAHLAVVAHNMSGEQLQQLSVFLHYFQLLGLLRRWGRHARQPGLQARGLHASQLGQGATQTQQAGVRALLRWVQKKKSVRDLGRFKHLDAFLACSVFIEHSFSELSNLTCGISLSAKQTNTHTLYNYRPVVFAVGSKILTCSSSFSLQLFTQVFTYFLDSVTVSTTPWKSLKRGRFKMLGFYTSVLFL